MQHLPSVKRLGWVPYLGAAAMLESVTLLGRYPVKVQPFWVPAVRAMEAALIDTEYENPCDWIGSYKKRAIAGTDYWSWHSYGGAIDLDYGGDNPDSPDHPLIDKNPHLHRRIYPGDPGFGVEFQLLEHQVRAIESIRTGNGKRVWRWLGWSIGDTMHFEPNCTPNDAATGIIYQGEDMTFTTWANGMFDLFDDTEILQLGVLGYWQPAPGMTVEEGATYWITLRDLGSEGRTTVQRGEVARFVQTIQVSSWVNSANTLAIVNAIKEQT